MGLEGNKAGEMKKRKEAHVSMSFSFTIFVHLNLKKQNKHNADYSLY